jgi:hypothetical protein
VCHLKRFGSFEIFTAVLLRISFFWDMKLDNSDYPVKRRHIKQEINFRSKFLLTIKNALQPTFFPHRVMIIFPHLIALSHADHHRLHHHHLFVIYLTAVSLRLQAYTLE